MKWLCAILVVFVCASGWTHSQTLSEIISAYKKAVDVGDRFQSVKSIVLNGKSQGGGGGQKRPITIAIQLPDKVRMDYELQPGLSFIRAFDGNMGWTVQPWTGSNNAQPLNEDDAKDVRRMVKMVWNDLLSDGRDGTTLEYNGKDEVEGSETFKITATHPDGAKIVYYLDVDSYLIAKTTTKYMDGGVQRESDVFPSDYKVVDGLTLPYALEFKSNGETAAVNYVEKYTFSNDISETSIFSMPAKKSNK